MQLWLDPGKIRARLGQHEGLRAAMAAALIDLHAGRASAPPRIAVQAPGGLLAVMPGAASGLLGAKLVSVFPDNPRRGLPAHQALIALFAEATGEPVAILDGTALTAARTAAVSAVATDALAGRDARVLTILGTGVQAEAHWQAVRQVRAFGEVRVAGRTRARVEARAAAWQARPMASCEAAVRGADVICACTHADQPVVRRGWLSAGAHVNSVGIGGAEIDRATVEAGLLAVESRAAFAPFPAGAYELQGLDPARGIELGAILGGEHPGRTQAAGITVFKSVGHAVEDVAAAAWLLRQAAC